MLNFLLVPLSIVLLGFLLYVGRPVLLPFVLALFLWYLLNALARTIAGFFRHRLFPLPEGLCLGISLLLLFSVLWFLGGVIISSVGSINESMPVYMERLEQLADRSAERLGMEGLPSLDRLMNVDVGALLTGVFSSLVNLLGNGGVVFLYIVFLLLEQRHFSGKLQALFSLPEHRQRVKHLLDAIDADIQTYLFLKTLTSMLTAVGGYVVMIWIGVDFAELWALMIFLLNFIPYLGSVIGVVLPLLFAVLQSLDASQLLILLGLLVGLQVLIGNVLEPRLLGHRLNLSPVVLLFTLGIWGGLWGGVGMFLAVPIMVMVMIVFSNIPSLRPVAILMSEDGCPSHKEYNTGGGG